MYKPQNFHKLNTLIQPTPRSRKKQLPPSQSPFIEIPKGQHCADFEHSFAYLLTFYRWNHAACIPVWHLLLSIMFVRVICTVA